MKNISLLRGAVRASRWLLALVLTSVVLSGCSLFEDRFPEFITFRMNGTAGDTVTVIYSKQFVAGVDELGTTVVEIFGADTVVHTLPIDTVVDVRLERRLYLQAEPSPSDTVPVDARVDVDGRSLYDDVGDLFPGIPWQFLYQFNTRTTDVIEVVF